MSGYIEREAIKKRAIAIPLGGKFVEVVPIGEIESFPAADVAPVVRCKDCIYIAEHAFVETDEAYCSEHDWCVSETYFCADGKKDGDGE